MLNQVSDLYDIAEYMNDPELTSALEFIAKVMLKPDIPLDVVSRELVKLQAIGAKCAMRATYMANVDKSDRPRKNMYYTASAEIDKLVSSLKYLLK
jgi:chemotaxis response regulator CheB